MPIVTRRLHGEEYTCVLDDVPDAAPLAPEIPGDCWTQSSMERLAQEAQEQRRRDWREAVAEYRRLEQARIDPPAKPPLAASNGSSGCWPAIGLLFVLLCFGAAGGVAFGLIFRGGH